MTTPAQNHEFIKPDQAMAIPKPNKPYDWEVDDLPTPEESAANDVVGNVTPISKAPSFQKDPETESHAQVFDISDHPEFIETDIEKPMPSLDIREPKTRVGRFINRTLFGEEPEVGTRAHQKGNFDRAFEHRLRVQKQTDRLTGRHF